MDPFGDGKTTVRLGYGLYFGPITNGMLLNNLLNTGSPLGQYTSSSFSPNSVGAPVFPNIIYFSTVWKRTNLLLLLKELQEP